MDTDYPDREARDEAKDLAFEHFTSRGEPEGVELRCLVLSNWPRFYDQALDKLAEERRLDDERFEAEMAALYPPAETPPEPPLPILRPADDPVGPGEAGSDPSGGLAGGHREGVGSLPVAHALDIEFHRNVPAASRPGDRGGKAPG